MVKLTRLLATLLLLSIVAQVFPAIDPKANYCKVGTCKMCKKSASGAKYCSSCHRSVQKLVEAATPDITECINKDSISNCDDYYPDSAASTGCEQCDGGFKSKDGGMVNSKPNKTCEKVTSVLPTPPNCDTSVVVDFLGTPLPFCSKCKSGFINDSLACTAWDGTGKIANCDMHVRESGTISCGSCSDGYYKKGNTCESVGTFTGCG